MLFHAASIRPRGGGIMHAPTEPGGPSTWRFRSSAASHPGAVRAHNEDSFVNRPDLGLWAVADGAGGHQAGDVASQIIADALNAVPPGFGAAELLAEVRYRLAGAHNALQLEATRRGGHAMLVSTIVVLLARDDYYACLWAGDSRAYLLCSDGLFKTLPEPELARIMGAEDDPPAEHLLRAALEQQPDDNVTAVAVEASHEPDWSDAERTELSAEDEPR